MGAANPHAWIREAYTPEDVVSPGPGNRMIGFPVDNAPPGNYELVMTIKDEIGGTSIELKEPFGIVAGDTPTPVADKPTGE